MSIENLESAIRSAYQNSPEGVPDDAVSEGEMEPIAREALATPITDADSFHRVTETLGHIRFRSSRGVPSEWVRDSFFERLNARPSVPHAPPESVHGILGRYSHEPHPSQREQEALVIVHRLLSTHPEHLSRFFMPASGRIRPDLFVWVPNPEAHGGLPFGERVAGTVFCFASVFSTAYFVSPQIRDTCGDLGNRANIPTHINQSALLPRLEAQGIRVPSEYELGHLSDFFSFLATGERRFEVRPEGLMLFPRLSRGAQRGTLLPWAALAAQTGEALALRSRLPAAILRAYGSSPVGYVSLGDYVDLLASLRRAPSADVNLWLSGLSFLDPTTGRHSDTLRNLFINDATGAAAAANYAPNF